MSRKYLGKRSKKIVSEDQFSILDPIDRSVETSKYKNLTPSNFGIDIWNAYEFSYLDKNLNPHLDVLEIIIPSSSAKTIESKSMKLYLNSFYDRSYKNKKEILEIIENDLSKICNSPVSVNFKKSFSKKPKSISIINSKLLFTESKNTYKFDAFRSLCPVTNQPDWAVIYLSFGSKVEIPWLVQYLSSFRETGEFHELCMDKIYSTIKNKFNLKKISVYGRFMRRGGIDINPIRSSTPINKFNNHREFSQ